MGDLVGIARFTFHDGKVEDFKQLSEQCMEIVRTQDPGTLEYSIYFNEDESEAIVLERYTDADALTAHLANIGEELMGKIMETAEIYGETLGEVPDEMREQMRGGPVQLFTPYRSM